MEIKTCEEYVLSQLKDAQEQIASLEEEIESLKVEIEYLNIQLVQTTQQTDTTVKFGDE